ncbi:MAG: response regulator [Chloroflexota bacterium]|nr:response regulator [Chloroflexota bacterium]
MMIENPTVLYVEDDALSREIMLLLLVEEMGLTHVTVFSDSSDFVARVQSLLPPPDVILLDIHVKPYGGFQMLALLRQQDAFRTTRVVALTASVMNEEIQQLKQAGFTSVLAKPIDQDIFPAQFARILNGEHLWRVVE